MGLLKWFHGISGKDEPEKTIPVNVEPTYREMVCPHCGGGGWLDGGGKCHVCDGKGRYFQLVEISITPKRQGG